jgi:hypothetical protein
MYTTLKIISRKFLGVSLIWTFFSHVGAIFFYENRLVSNRTSRPPCMPSFKKLSFIFSKLWSFFCYILYLCHLFGAIFAYKNITLNMSRIINMEVVMSYLIQAYFHKKKI